MEVCTHTDQVHHEQDFQLAVMARAQVSPMLCQSPEGSEQCLTYSSEKSVTRYIMQAYENSLISTNGS